MTEQAIEHLRVGLRRADASVTLRLRRDRSPQTCDTVLQRLPAQADLWHAKYAHNEIYMLVDAWTADPPREWACAYPGIGDLMYIPHPPRVLPEGGSTGQHVVDLAYFYERGNTLYGPFGPAIGNIFATAVSMHEAEAFAQVCHRVWYEGIKGETMYIEAIDASSAGEIK